MTVDGPFLKIEGVSKRFGAFQALHRTSLAIGRGEVFSLLGPSGCGKTTLLRLIAGFEQPDEGRIFLDGQDITDLPPEKRPVNTVFQNYALFPHLNVRDNIGFGLRMAGRSKPEIENQVREMMQMVDLAREADKMPAKLSGGQKQRVAIARALVNQPRVLLLDEPLAALDLKLRQRLLAELESIHERVGITFLYVTHDQGEAMSISNRLAVMEGGRIRQIGSPEEVYARPRSAFVARFIGDTNFLEITKVDQQKGVSRGKVEGLGWLVLPEKARPKSGDFLSIRPEKILAISNGSPVPPGWNQIEAKISAVLFAGAGTRLQLAAAEHTLLVDVSHGPGVAAQTNYRTGQEVKLAWNPAESQVLKSAENEEDA